MLNFSLSELIFSNTAIKHNISNMPDIQSLDNLLKLVFYCLQPIRNLINMPMIITSGYRSLKLNSLVGGKANSLHLFGCAADFKVKSLKPSQIIEIIKASDIEFDQLINEYDKWVHISYLHKKNRKQVLFIK